MNNNAEIETIIDRYYSRVYRFIETHIKNGETAKDLTQNVFFDLFKSRTSYESIEDMDAYIFSIARNTIYREFRKIKNSRELKQEFLHDMRAKAVQCDDPVVLRDLEYNFEKVIDNLPDQQRIVFYLSRREGLTHQQIAMKLGISANTVKNHMVQALKTLRGKYELMGWFIFMPLIFRLAACSNFICSIGKV